MNTVTKIENFIKKYVTLGEEYYSLPVALWSLATHTWPTFDSFPYLVITAYVKRSGKTTLMERICGISANGRTFSPDSPASMFRALGSVEEGENADENSGTKPVMFLDEAEKLNKENHPAREFLNKGYRKGQTITRVLEGGVKDLECYCPKCFVQIGDVYDTLKDRSIVIVMKRRSPVEAAKSVRVRQELVKKESEELRGEMSVQVAELQEEISNVYLKGFDLDFLNERDEEIWNVIFTMCKVFCPERIEELKSTAVDMCMEKQAEKRKATGEEWREAENEADNAEYRVILVKDMLAILEQTEKEFISSQDAEKQLKEITTAPWRKFRGRGITTADMGALLDVLSVKPKPTRIKSGEKTEKAIIRGYHKKDLLAAAINVGLRENPF